MRAGRPAVALLAGSLALVGCSPTRSGLRDDSRPVPTIGHGDRVIVPKQCAVKTALVARPIDDEALGSVLWAVADAQAVGDETRRAWAANGLRLGVVTGELPPEVRAVLDAPPPHRVDPATVILPDGDSSLFDLAATGAELTVMLDRGGAVAGKRYRDAKGYLRLTARRADDSAVTVQIVPELHHGPVRQGWGVAPGGGSFAPRQFVVHNGQAEETFRDLGAAVELRPGQVAVLGALPGRKGSLGHFLFTAPEPNSDRLMQKVLFVWASPFQAAPGSRPEGSAPKERMPIGPSDTSGSSDEQ